MKLSEMYRIPWTKYDNPNGWVEVTTECQLTCPGCYRSLTEEEEKDPDKRLLQVKEEVDTLVRIRNIQALSIAGGEPLLFPRLDELITYTRSKGVAPRLYTNGVKLTEQRLRKLKDAGIGEVIIHASLWQGRLTLNTQEELLALKDKYCDMFRAVGGVGLGFIEPMMRRNLEGLKTLFGFYQENSDIIRHVVFTTFKDEYGGPEDQYVPPEEASEKIVEHYGTEPCAYIPKVRHPEKVAWVLNVVLLKDGEVIGGLDGNSYGLMQDQYREAMGKYLFSPEPSGSSNGNSLSGPGGDSEDGSELVEEFRQGMNYQVVSIVDSPQRLEDGTLDVCDSCPDAILHEGELVPKCVLDRIKEGLGVQIVR